MNYHSLKLLSFFIMTLLLASCVVMINENDYRELSETQKKQYLKPFDISVFSNHTNNDSLVLYELNSENIKTVTKKFPYTLVHLWRPFCKAEACLNIGYYQNVQEKYKKQGLKVLFVSETYDINDIKKRVRDSHFEMPVFVLQDSCYGHKMKKNKQKLLRDFTHKSLTKREASVDDLFFKDTTLVYAGFIPDDYVLDSLMNIKSGINIFK